MTVSIKKIFPFLRWFPLRRDTLKADFFAGLTVALVLVPQSMAYAQLAGLPAYYGLYASFLPVMVASLWGSSSQLGTGPVAVVSLLTASTLAPLAVPGSEQFIALAILMALLVGVVQITLGIFKLGVIVNFLSHPVIVGFTNAAAMIIGLSQVNKLLGVAMGRSESFINDIWEVMKQVGDTHLPTLAMGVVAIIIIWSARRWAPKLPGVLIAVAVTSVASWALHFERNTYGTIDQIADQELKTQVARQAEANRRIDNANKVVAVTAAEAKQAHKIRGDHSAEAVTRDAILEATRISVEIFEMEAGELNKSLRSVQVVRAVDDQGKFVGIHAANRLPAGLQDDGATYHLRGVKDGNFKLVGGGDVVGKIPEGLPSIKMPTLNWDMIKSLLGAAFVISLVGFMEAISIAKAIAAKTKDKVDPNQELIGQGLANIVGASTQAFPVSGSFSRSAVNFNAGAKTGMSAVFTGLIVLLTLLFLTPLLYFLPQAALAAVIIMAVVGLINFSAIKHAWLVNKHDGIAAIVTFVATLAFAPHLDKGIMVGAGLALVLYLYRTMTPRVAILGRYRDGTLRDVKVNNLPASDIVTAVRFDGRLYFANVSYFEDAILEAVAANPEAPYLLVVCDGINEVDASGEEVIHHLVERLHDIGVVMMFSGFKKQVLDVIRKTGLSKTIGEECFFATSDQALEKIYSAVTKNVDAQDALRPLSLTPVAPAVRPALVADAGHD
ncbi:MAG: SulP family inorganic anion transporter [Gammaproteobacteria bacterium]|nr:SulP family inorganic anion transporter [Rhodocyclaceae bacterium]MBU3908393.1 SulP family inorganic anion transporter [Gammaproteobacteria bacterium]MBU3988611.1 SulP family inorganic anion transporter [Gammaproteobacteria bacterium]MBU4004103.1 SulP family inorganic anion transporter [Gammaproteobacteria bacterium]MBU4020350.1 SulP family inorganic anion transporter [Gammaproteobacteria bacterium]